MAKTVKKQIVLIWWAGQVGTQPEPWIIREEQKNKLVLSPIDYDEQTQTRWYDDRVKYNVPLSSIRYWTLTLELGEFEMRHVPE